MQLKHAEAKTVLVLGIDTTALAASANNAGYTVFAVDYFGDQDLRRACKSSMSIVAQEAGKSYGRLEENFSPSKFSDLSKTLLRKFRIDAILLGSGLEDYPEVLEEINDQIPIAGNDPDTIRNVRDKAKFFREVRRLGMSSPETAIAKDIGEGRRVAKDIGYPVIIKPVAGFGGVGVRKANDRGELVRSFQQIAAWPQGFLIQEFVEGTSASVAFLSTGDRTRMLTLTEQLLGIRELGQREQFGYCGSVVPACARDTVIDACRNLVKKTAAHFGLVGSNGLDLVVSEQLTPFVIEVNPRFQGTLECVERVLGLNMVEAHMKACFEGTLTPSDERKPKRYCARLILYARHRSIAPDLVNLREARDVPLPGVVVEDGEPLCSVVVEEEARDYALKRAKALSNLIYKTTQAASH